MPLNRVRTNPGKSDSGGPNPPSRTRPTKPRRSPPAAATAGCWETRPFARCSRISNGFDQPRSLSQSKIAANVGCTSAQNSASASSERSGLLLSAHQFSTRMNVEATYWIRTAGGIWSAAFRRLWRAFWRPRQTTGSRISTRPSSAAVPRSDGRQVMLDLFRRARLID